MIKFITEYLPIIIFFVFYKLYGIFYATASTLVATILALSLSLILKKEINKTTIISSILLVISSSLTLLTKNAIFIKMKPTFLYIIFGLTILISMKFNKLIIKSILEKNVNMEDSNWIILSRRFAFFFIGLAFSNEIIWRNFSENFWVNYKLFGTTILMFIFLLSQLSFIRKHIIPHN